MKVTGASGDGNVQVDSKHNYYVRVPSNTPYCHLCRKRVDVVAEVVPGNPGNPRHACKSCLQALLGGFEAVENEQTRTRNSGAVAS